MKKVIALLFVISINTQGVFAASKYCSSFAPVEECVKIKAASKEGVALVKAKRKNLSGPDKGKTVIDHAVASIDGDKTFLFLVEGIQKIVITQPVGGELPQK